MAARRVAVAASGGRDSTALLHCTVRQAAALGLEVVALHVHHGLMPQADQWLQQVQAQARRWGARFAATRLQDAPEPGQSIEAWARKERYRALAAMAQEAGCTVVLLAHHRRDQAETWLLQALRGAGAAGLSAMPLQAQRQGLNWCRPWLQQPREAVEAYVRRHRLKFIDDSSNGDARYARNRLRLQLWPALLQAFPDAETALMAAATHAQEAQALAVEVARADLKTLWPASARRADDPGGAPVEAAPVNIEALPVPAWLELPPARRANALRHWLRLVLAQGAPETLVQRLLQDLVPWARATAAAVPKTAASGAATSVAPVAPRDTNAKARGGVRWPAPAGELRLHKGQLVYARGVLPTTSGCASMALPPPITLDLSRPGTWPVPAWGGRFHVQLVSRGGAPLPLLRRACLRPRAGGERFAAQAVALPRSLKKQYQSAAIPSWQRQGPLVWAADGRLLFVPALGLNADCLAAAGQPQCSLQWLPDGA